MRTSSLDSFSSVILLLLSSRSDGGGLQPRNTVNEFTADAKKTLTRGKGFQQKLTISHD
jgi:hypothetical protein